MRSSIGSVYLVAEALSQGERSALKAIKAGELGTVSIVQLGNLKSLDLISHNGRNIQLTADGRAVVEFC